ncbi:MAG: flagellar protein FlaG [Gammaproteobacteria bacterium]
MSSESIPTIQLMDMPGVQGLARTDREKISTAIDVSKGQKALDSESKINGSELTSTDAIAEKVEDAVVKISDYVQNLQRDLQFNVDKDSGRVVIKVLDSKTNELIRQIPSEEILELAGNVGDGVIIREQA